MRTCLALAFGLALFAFGSGEPPRLVMQTTHPRTDGRVALSPDGRYLATADKLGSVRFWEVQSGNILQVVDIDREIAAIAFAPDGTLVAVDSSGASFLSAPTGRVIGRIDSKAGCLDVAAFHRQAATATGDVTGKVFLLDAARKRRGAEIGSLDGMVRHVAVSMDDSLVGASSIKGAVKVFTAGGKLKLSLTGRYPDSPVTFSSDSKLVATMSDDQSVQVHEVDSGRLIQSLAKANGLPRRLLSFRDAERLVFQAADEGRFSAVEYDARSGQRVAKVVQMVGNGEIAFTDDRTKLLTTVNDVISLRSSTSEQLIQTFTGIPGGVSFVSIAPDGKTAYTATEEGKVFAWDTQTNQPLASSKGLGGEITGMAFTPDGQSLITADASGVIAQLSASTLAIQSRTAVSFDDHPVRGLALAHSGFRIATIDNTSGMVYIVNLAARTRATCQATASSRALAFAPSDDELAVGDASGRVLLFKLDELTKPKVLSAHERGVVFVGYSADGSIICSASEDGTAKFWETATLKLKGTAKFSGKLTCGAVSADGQTIALGGWLDGVTLFDAATGKRIRQLPERSSNIRSVAIMPDGSKILTGDRDGASRMWPLDRNGTVTSRYACGGNDWVVIDGKGRYDGTEEGKKFLHYARGDKTIPLDALFEQFSTPGLLGQIPKKRPSDPTPKPVVVPKAPTPKVNIDDLKDPTTVQIVSPNSDQIVDKDTATIVVEAKNGGGGIDEVVLFQNGKKIGGASRDLVEIPQPDAETFSKTFVVQLSPGENVFEAAAFNRERTKAKSQKPLKLTLKKTGTAGNLYVIAVGINDYVTPEYRLTYALNDSSSFAKQLQDQAKGLFANVEVVSVSDRKATNKGIVDAFAGVAAKAQPGDTFVFYYSGHGLVTQPEDGTQGQFVMVLSDVGDMKSTGELESKGLTAKQLTSLCVSVKAQHQLLIVDACHAGALLDAGSSAGDRKALEIIARNAGVAIFAGTSGHQVASEIRDLKHGLFTFALLNGLRGEAKPGSGPRKISSADLNAYLYDKVPDLVLKYGGQAQEPVTLVFGSFPIVITKN